MAKIRVHATTVATASITVEVPDEALALNDDDLESVILDANPEFPRLCAQCTGWGRDFGLDLGDEWEVVEIEELDAGGHPRDAE